MSEIDRLYTVRDFAFADKSFIKATMLRGLHAENDWFNLIPRQIFMEIYSILLDNLLASPNVQVKLACLKDDPDVILGYAILSTDNTVLHWCYTKKEWRNQGIAKRLIPAEVQAITHFSKLGLKLMKQKLQTCVFNPFLVS